MVEALSGLGFAVLGLACLGLVLNLSLFDSIAGHQTPDIPKEYAFSVLLGSEILVIFAYFSTGDYLWGTIWVGNALATYYLMRRRFGPPGKMLKLRQLLPRWARG